MMNKIKLTVLEIFDDPDGNQYIEIKIGHHEACYDGNEVYSYIGGADCPLRMLRLAESYQILKFANTQFERR